MSENYMNQPFNDAEEMSLDNILKTGMELTKDDDPQIDPILPSQMTSAQKLPNEHAITLSDAMDQYYITQQLVENLQKKPITHFWGNAAKGVGDFLSETATLPDRLNAMVTRAFNGHMFPNMTEYDAVRLMESTTNYLAASSEARQYVMQYEGAEDSISRTFFAGASQVIAYGLVGALTGGVGVAVLAGLEEASNLSQEMAENYMAKNDGSLKEYKGSEDFIFAAAHGALSGWIEQRLGAERLFTNAIKKTGAKKLTQGLISSAAQQAIGEGAEEYLQEASNYLFTNMAGRNDRTFGEFQRDAITNAVYGAALGGVFGGLMYYPNKARIKKSLIAQGFHPDDAALMTTAMINEAQSTVMNEVNDRLEIRNHYGEQWDALKNKIVVALENAGWKETNPNVNLAKYAEDNADAIVAPLFRMSNKFGMDSRDLLQLAEIDVIDNALYLRPGKLGTAEDIAQNIKDKQAQVKRLTMLARTGAGNPDLKKSLNTQIELLQKYHEKLTGDRFVAARRIRVAKAKRDAETLVSTAPDISEIIENIDTSKMTSGEPTKQIRQRMDGRPFVYVGDKQLPVEYKVVPMEQVIASHIGQEANPNYTLKELQNRAQRGSRTDVSILQSRAAKIQPENLGIAYNTQNGAPIVNERGEVIAGNGRFEVIRMANERGRAQYGKYLKSLGLNLDGIKNPVLVRVMNGLTPAEQIAVADASNISATSAFDNAAQAAQDAKLLRGTDGITDFLNKIPTESRQGLFLANDRVNRVALERRYNDALMMWLLNGDINTYEDIYLMGSASQKIQSALQQSIPSMMALENQYPDVGIRADLAESLKKLPSVMRSSDFANSISQTSIDDSRTNLFNQNALLYAMIFGKNTKTWEGTGPDRLQVGMTLPEFFDTYTRIATNNQENIGKTDLFGQPMAAERTSGDILAETLTLAFPREFEDGTAKSRNMRAVFLTRAQTQPGPTQFSQIDLRDTVQPSLLPADTSTASAVRNLPWEKPVNVSSPIMFNRMPEAADIEMAKANGYDSFLILDKEDAPNKLVLLDGTGIGLTPGAKIPTGAELYKPKQSTRYLSVDGKHTTILYSGMKGARLNDIDSKPMWLSSKQSVAQEFLGESDNSQMFIGYATAKNPLVVDGHGRPWHELKMPEELGGGRLLYKTDNIADKAFKSGYDAVIFKNIKETESSIGGYLFARKSDSVVVKNAREQLIFEEDAEPSMLNQGRRVNGFYDPELEVIVLGRNSNTGTLPHEMAHFWANTIFNLVKTGQYNNNPDFMAQAMGMFKILGVGMNQDSLTRDQQESFASMTEAVIFGMASAPNGTELPMTAFLNWVPAKYKSILDIGYRNSDGRIVNPILDKQAVEWFNAWYANGTLPAIDASPLAMDTTNPTVGDRILPSSAPEIKTRGTEMNTESEVLARARNEQTQEAIESTPLSARAAADAASVMIDSMPGNIERSTPPAPQRKGIISHLIPGRGTNTRADMFAAARDYIAKDRAHAEEVAFGNPIEVMNDTGVDRAILIRAVMENYSRGDVEYGQLYHNLAETVSLAGKTPGLSNDLNFQYYLKALNDITNGMEGRVAMKYAGGLSLAKARRTFNSDIDAFIQERANDILRAGPDTQRREDLIKAMLAEARTKFGADTDNVQLLQEELNRAKSMKSGQNEVFTAWARRQIKKMLKAEPDGELIRQTMEISERAEKARLDLDSNDIAKAQAAVQTVREWQMFVADKQVPSTWLSRLIGSWYPKAMLYNINSHTVNVTGTGINTGLVDAVLAIHYLQGNKVSKDAMTKENARLKALYDSSLVNLASMEDPASPSLLKGEQYNPREGKSTIGKIADFSMDMMGKEDAFFRRHVYLNALGRIATADAAKTGGSPTELFMEYKKINNTKGTRAYEARLEALRIADIAVFQQNGTLAAITKKIRDALNMGNKAGFGTLMIPFAKTPANIVEMGIRAVGAPVTGTYHAITGQWTINDTLDAGYFVLGSLIVAACMADYEPPYESGHRYDPNKPYDSVRIPGTDAWIKIDTFGPASTPIRILSSIISGKGLGIAGTLNDAPFIGELSDTYAKLQGIDQKPWEKGFGFVAKTAFNRVNTAVPAVIKSVLAAAHPADLDLDEIDLGLPKTGIGRKIGRQYGLAGGDTTTNDILRIFFNRLKINAE